MKDTSVDFNENHRDEIPRKLMFSPHWEEKSKITPVVVHTDFISVYFQNHILIFQHYWKTEDKLGSTENRKKKMLNTINTLYLKTGASWEVLFSIIFLLFSVPDTHFSPVIYPPFMLDCSIIHDCSKSWAGQILLSVSLPWRHSRITSRKLNTVSLCFIYCNVKIRSALKAIRKDTHPVHFSIWKRDNGLMNNFYPFSTLFFFCTFTVGIITPSHICGSFFPREFRLYPSSSSPVVGLKHEYLWINLHFGKHWSGNHYYIELHNEIGRHKFHNIFTHSLQISNIYEYLFFKKIWRYNTEMHLNICWGCC